MRDVLGAAKRPHIALLIVAFLLIGISSSRQTPRATHRARVLPAEAFRAPLLRRTVEDTALATPKRPEPLATEASVQDWTPDDTVLETGGVLAFNNRRYGVTFRTDGVDVAPASPRPIDGLPRITLALRGVRSGGVDLAASGDVTPTVSAADHFIDYARGAVTERYQLQRDAVEQLFVINERPAGDIDVRVAIDSNVPVMAEGANLVFAGGPGRIVIEGATVFDAEGRTLDVPMQWSDGGININVPAAWAAQAALPITVDPMIFPSIVIDASTGFTWGWTVGLVFNNTSNEWLMVWNEQVGASATDYDVWARRVRFDGAILPPAIAVSTGPSTGAYEASVAWSSAVNRYLIVWRGTDFATGVNGVYGRMLNGGGATFFNAATLLSGNQYVWNPQVAYGNSRFYLVYAAPNGPGSWVWDINGSFWSNTMTAMGASNPNVGAGTHCDYAMVAYSASAQQFLAVWQEGPISGGPSAIRGRRASATTNAQLGAAFAISTSASSCVNSNLRADGSSNWLVTWDELTAAFTGNLQGRLVKSTGAMPGAAFNIAATAWAWWSTAGGWAAVEWDATRNFFHVVWATHNATADAFNLRARSTRVNGTTGLPTMGAPFTLLTSSATISGQWPSIALNTRTTSISYRWLGVGYWNSWSPGSIRGLGYFADPLP